MIQENKYARGSKESEVLATYFAALLNKFHLCLFSVDFDDPKTPNADVFQIFNKSWKHFAKEHNKKAKKFAADMEAFENYAIKQDTNDKMAVYPINWL